MYVYCTCTQTGLLAHASSGVRAPAVCVLKWEAQVATMATFAIVAQAAEEPKVFAVCGKSELDAYSM